MVGGRSSSNLVPFPYWELSYTVDPTYSPAAGRSVTTSVFPQFTVQVMDYDDPNYIVRVITPPGGINPDNWKTDDPRPWLEKFYEGQKKYYFVINARFLNSYTLNIKVPSEYVGQF
jgi:hypothetical protein